MYNSGDGGFLGGVGAGGVVLASLVVNFTLSNSHEWVSFFSFISSSSFLKVRSVSAERDDFLSCGF